MRDKSFHDPEVDPEHLAIPAVVHEQHISVPMTGHYAFYLGAVGPASPVHVMAHFRKAPSARPTWVFLGCEVTGELEGGTKIDRYFWPQELEGSNRHAPAWLVTVIERITPQDHDETTRGRR